ncbi:MAG: hypothetical protein LBO74_10460 [Candidatus Symbiothrix sp.]|jgi:hypothetical protein|nr:hypothetical protein [Candidatus Symbiothrix sp.]
MERIEMKNERIKQLLEHYWQCETSLEDEQVLQEFFSGNDVPEELKAYTSLFTWKEKQKNNLPDKNRISIPKKPLAVHFYPILRIAATVLVIITLGIGFYTHYQQEKFMDKMFSETYTDPEDAVKETGEVIAKVSSLLQLVPGKTISTEKADSLELHGMDFLNDSKE